MRSLGGCKPFSLNNYPKRFRKYIKAYTEHKIDSVTATYIVMRNKEKQNENKDE